MANEYVSILVWLLSSIFFLLTIAVAFVIISENRNPVRALAWLTILTVMPVIGLILYFIFGRDIKNKRIVKRKLKRKLKRIENAVKPDLRFLPFTDGTKQIVKAAHTLSHAGLHVYNDAKVFTDGKSKFESFIDDINRAQSYIYIQYYIVSDDNIGTRLSDALIKKAESGVRVYMIYDPVGSVSTGKKYFKKLTQAGVKVKPFIPVKFPAFGTRINWRNHRKQCVIDGKIGYMGGMNVADRYIDGGKSFDMWRDIHLRVEGNIVTAIESSFITDWSFMGDDYEPLVNALNPEPSKSGEIAMQLVTSGPTSQWFNLEMLFIKAIGKASNNVFIETPYFLPSEGLLNTLQAASLGGVDVRILIPRRSDSAILTYASSSYINDCIKSGIKVYFYEPGMLHSKSMIIDDEIVTVGSTNFDFRSFEHNFEGNLFIYSTEFNKLMTRVFKNALNDSTRVAPEIWNRRSRVRKIKESLMRLLAPIL